VPHHGQFLGVHLASCIALGYVHGRISPAQATRLRGPPS
jgi:hypothetical protein